ncbi:hypothetical protein FW774_08985 [Pedobacter sp. BS3]|uniref:hypothetical protein n=1 Tax=Pedobacter sp. BS3 TaxID=2567937 RepID=UPI0011EF9FD7|nr:hypothetical protein [Pedobacter sp. BS3]TZF83603.1 hypothetical protein FW774_08985 [Pedobacter sp. BS3]
MNKKTIITLAVLFALSTPSMAQKKKDDPKEKPDATQFNWEKSKLIPKLKKLAITELTVNYKLTTTARTVVQEKGSRQIAGARVTAYLETTDGDLTNDDFQGLTDHFYDYFQKKLKENGIDTVGWNQVTATEFYQKIGSDDEKSEDDSKKETGGNKWVASTAHKGKIVHSGMAGFAGGKGKRAQDFAKDLDCVAAAFKVNVDFADVVLNLDLKTTARKDLFDGWYYPATTTKKYTWAINPEFRVGDQDNKQWTYAWGSKGWPEYLYQWNDIPAPGAYAETMTEDPSKARSGLAKQFAFAKELTPVLIQTTRSKYKAAATHAIEKWVDAFVARAVQMRKG